MCIKPIKGGSFLSYDYQFDTAHASTFPCACGSKNCRGTMKGGKSEEGVGGEEGGGAQCSMSRDERLKSARAREDKDKAYIGKVEAARLSRLNEVGTVVPGSTKGNEEMVLAGPQVKYRDAIREGNVALWRNAKRGYEGILMKGAK